MPQGTLTGDCDRERRPGPVSVFVLRSQGIRFLGAEHVDDVFDRCPDHFYPGIQESL